VAEEVLDAYNLKFESLVASVKIVRTPKDFVPEYHASIQTISKNTRIILDKIRDEFISQVVDHRHNASGEKQAEVIESGIRERFHVEVKGLLEKYFPGIDEETSRVLVSYMVLENLGLGTIEILLKDERLEEIVINSSKDNVWVYHKKFGWLKTNIKVKDENRIRHYSTMIGRDVGKDITVLHPLMDAHLRSGDRVNATLSPISTSGNTITIRKFAAKPWIITDFISSKTISLQAAAFVWLAIQHELSTLIVGGTGSGKTSMLNVIASFFPPNQRIISIEDTREITLPKSLHWVPMETRMPNPEGKGGVSMLDLVVNSLRMRPDRILVGEIRRKREAEVLFEAMHTGHSVYATLHANNAEEAVMRLTNPPIDIPKAVLPALSLLLVQNRNRRTGNRRTLQLAEIVPSGDAKVFMQLDAAKDCFKSVKEPAHLFGIINLYTGMTSKEIKADLDDKAFILKNLVKLKGLDVHKLGYVFAKYYTADNFSVKRIPSYIKESR